MDRLTKRYEHYDIIDLTARTNTNCSVICHEMSDCESCPVNVALSKLADYEDAEGQGLLLKLPCKVGDTVFLVQCGKVYERKVSGFSITSNNRFVVHVPDCEMDNATLPVEWFGKRAIFSTREEAEAALAEKGGAE